MTAHTSRFFYSLQVAAHRLQKAADQTLMDAANISTSQAAVLITIRDNPLMRQNSVALTLGLNESAITAMVNRLIGMSLVKRHRSQVDARAWELELTQTGQDALKAIEKPFSQINDLIDEIFKNQTDDVAHKLVLMANRVDRFVPQGTKTV